MKLKYFHATKSRLKPGQRLTGTSSSVVGKNYESSYTGYIHITGSPYPHFTIKERAIKEKWFVYEVIPIGKIEKGIWDDIVVPEIEIKKLIGRITSNEGLGKKTSEVTRSRKTGKLIVEERLHYNSLDLKGIRTKDMITPIMFLGLDAYGYRIYQACSSCESEWFAAFFKGRPMFNKIKL